jgi:diguanylate cyclase (GGDEF)-like protein
VDLFAALERMKKPFLLAAGFLLIAVIGAIDYLTGYELGVSAFYLIPVALLAWGAGMWPGLIGSLAGALVWGFVDMKSGHIYSSTFIIYWNGATRLVIFAVMSLLLSFLKQSIRHEREQSRIDYLTQAVNTRSFLETLESEIDRSRRYGRPFTLAYLDLDNFKHVNDSLGHNEGDTVLRTVVAVIKDHMRSTDTVARLGGDEFAILLPETNLEAARTAISKIHASILAAMDGTGWPVTASIGSLTCVAAASDVDECIRQADDLMYAAKAKGKNGVVFALSASS